MENRGKIVADPAIFTDHYIAIAKAEQHTSYIHVFIFMFFLYFLTLMEIEPISECCYFLMAFILVMFLAVNILPRETLKNVALINQCI